MRTHAPDAEVIVVDNASTDGTADVARSFPGVLVIESATNEGFGAACNKGAAAATSPVLFFLNQDARLESSIDDAIRELLGEPELGVLGARVSFESGTQQPSIGRSPTAHRVLLEWLGYPLRVLGLAASSSLMRRRSELYSQPTPGDWISGSSLFIRRELFARLGGFSDRYFMYVEDADLCARVRSEGHAVRLCPAVAVTHAERSGTVGISSFSMVHTLRGQARYIAHFSGPLRARLVMASLAPLFMALSLAGRLASWAGGGDHARVNAKAFGSAVGEALSLGFGRRLEGGRR